MKIGAVDTFAKYTIGQIGHIAHIKISWLLIEETNY